MRGRLKRAASRAWSPAQRVLAAGAFVVASLLGGSPAGAQLVTVELRNGDRISGHIVSESTNSVVLSNAWAARLTIPAGEISKRILATNAVLAAGATNKGPTNAVQMAKVVASTNSLFTSPWLKHWHGELQVGADLTFSERNRQVYNAKSKVTYAKDRFKSVIDYDTTYGRSEVDQTITDSATGTTRTERRTVTDANRMNGSVKFEYDITKRWYVYNLGGAGYDEIRKIDVRYEVGPGLGYHVVQKTNFLANAELGFNYQDEQHSDNTSDSTFYFRLGENVAWKITPRLTWDEKFEYTPRVEDPSQYRMRFETNLRYALLQNIFANLSIIDIYDSERATGVSPNDLQVRSSVGVKF